LPLPTQVQRWMVRVSFAPQPVQAVMARQSMSLVVQHRASSSQVSRGLPVELPDS
jgi:hypothetical protein